MDKENVKNLSNHSIISNSPGPLDYRDTLENTAQILELLEYLDLSEGLTRDAQFGLFLVLETVIQSLRQVGEDIQQSF